MYRFIRVARRSRQFPLPEETPPADLLRHLNLLNKRTADQCRSVGVRESAPQRFLISSEVKCAHFHGTQIAKPIPSYQIYKGTVFQLVDKAVDFVLSKIALSVGTRAESVQAPVAYEVPQEVVTEAIVNAVAHRDYTDNSSVQVMLFADRLEVMNSGRLPPSLTVEKLRVAHQSLPANPRIAEPMYLLRYIERMGTGTVDMIRRCAEAGLPEPEFEAGAGFVARIWRKAEATADSATPITTPITTPKTVPERILALLAADPRMTRKQLAERLGITLDGIKYHMRRLKESGAIVRVGSSRAGHWRVLETEVSGPARKQPENSQKLADTTRKPSDSSDAERERNPGLDPEGFG